MHDNLLFVSRRGVWFALFSSSFLLSLLREELNRFLLAYRSMPHSTTGKSPAELLFRRKLTTKMPDLVNVEEEEVEVSN